MVFQVLGSNPFCSAIYKVTTEDGTYFHCLLKSYKGKTCYDKPVEEIMLYKNGESWKSDKRIYKDLTNSLGASIDKELMLLK